jgi:paraquat-inducible protein B
VVNPHRATTRPNGKPPEPILSVSKKANPTFIGIFVFIGLALGAGGLLLFSSSRLFTRTAKYIVYFESSLNGLNDGAPVKYRGVTIGSVSRMMIRYNQARNDRAMPVIIEVREDLVRQRMVGGTLFTHIGDLNDDLRKGLRARLETESLVTGLLYVSLEVENSPPPAIYHELEKTFPEIPSRPTDIQQLMKNLASMDIPGLEQKITSLLDKVDSALAALRVSDITGTLTNVLSSANRVVTAPDLTNAFTSLKTTLDQYRVLAEKVNGRVDPLADSLTNTFEQLNHTLLHARGGMQNLRDLLAPDSPLRHDLTLTLEQLTEASESVAALAEFLHSHPNALLTGRKTPPGKHE